MLKMQNENKNVREQIQYDALEIAKKYNKVGLAVSMGVGKTYIGLQHMSWYLESNPDAKFLVAAPKISIFTSWKDDAVKFNLDYLIEKIHFTTYRSLINQDMDYDVLYLDECHSLLWTHDFWLSGFSGDIIGLTGTPPRHDYTEKGEMVKKHCPVKFKYITDDAVDAGILNNYKIIVHVLDLSNKKDLVMSTKTGKTWVTSERAQYEFWNNKVENGYNYKDLQISRIMRMRALMDFKTKETYARNLLNSLENKCLVFCNTQEQADRVCKHSYHANNSDSEQNLIDFKHGTIDKLSCVMQLNEGVNIPNLKSGIILHAYSNERKSNQRIGRLLRLNPDETATIHILMYSGTVDESWIHQALNDLDPKKIIYTEKIIF